MFPKMALFPILETWAILETVQHEEALQQIPDKLAILLGSRVVTDAGQASADGRPDLVLKAQDHVFSAEYSVDPSTSQVGSAIRQLEHYRAAMPEAIPLVVVPYMGGVGERLCEAAEMSWLDLSGNANITAPGLRVHVKGNPNLFKRPGQPKNLFSPGGSRLARALLLQPHRTFSQSDLSIETGLGRGTTSKLIRRYEDAGFVTRELSGQKADVRLADYDLLLNAWHQAYDFSTHRIHRGHVSAGSGMELLQRLVDELETKGIEYAATGLAAAWLLEPFAAFRLVTVYLRERLPEEVRVGLRFREEPRGSNVWLVLPKDEGVFKGAGVKDGIRHVSAVQAYLDLKDQPERSAEAAEELRHRLLGGSALNG